jgi:hypothetical protein
MSTALCSTACGEAAALPTNYYNCDDNTRRFIFKHFVLDKCTTQYDDILDANELADKAAAGEVLISPPGFLTLPAPDQTLVPIDGDTDVIGDITYTVDFVTYRTSSGNVEDWEFFKALHENHSNYRLRWFDSINGDERWAMEDDWIAAIAGGAPATVSGTSPGFKFSVTVLPHWTEGEGTKGQFVTQFQIKTSGMISMAMIPGAAAALYATQVGS